MSSRTTRFTWPRDYDGTCATSKRDHVLSDDPSLYVQNACVTDPSLAPPGMSTLYVLAPVTHQHPNIDWARDEAASAQSCFGNSRKLGIATI